MAKTRQQRFEGRDRDLATRPSANKAQDQLTHRVELKKWTLRTKPLFQSSMDFDKRRRPIIEVEQKLHDRRRMDCEIEQIKNILRQS
ncbi:MAG: hypothetical protein ACTS3R_08585 [Inquilinaceae bacterium]